ncbi:MAG: aminopeptidase, partial [Bdellovibrionales bacterium]|nr:aminopeptidase [Bdellovibrionales bacterium]
ASWYRQGFDTVFPFESTANDRNRKIHTAKDVINDSSSFEHSLMFSKLALAFAMELSTKED